MIVKISAPGKSFKGLSDYLTHDPKSMTEERVAWTRTHNLANDDIPSAINEMYLTAENAELLKQEAGIRAGGRSTEKPVKHVSLNWDPADNPSEKHMINTAEHFLERMGWSEHQAIFISHSDKPYKHVHLVLNAIHPETGRHLSESWEKNRAQKWAAEYERTQDCIRCPQRLLDRTEREKAMPRNMWVAFQENEKEFSRAENTLRQQDAILHDDAENQKNQNNDEWRIMKEIQRHERISFFNDGKSEFSELRKQICREVRDEFRARWRDFYACEDGMDPDTRATVKAGIIADRKAVLESRRDEACRDLREYRDGLYRELLDDQREMRLDLRARQDAGLDNSEFLAGLTDRPPTGDIRASFHSAAEAATRWNGGEERGLSAKEDRDAHSVADTSSAAPPFVMGAFTVFDSVLSIFEGPSRNPPPRSWQGIMREAADDTCKREQRAREEADDEWREKQRSRCE
jgi:hypothetical protein